MMRLATRRHLLLGAAATVLLNAGCGFFLPREARIPMDVLKIPRCPHRQASTLVVMLPGVYSRPQEFVEAGFLDEMVARRVDADVMIADSHMGYVLDGSVLTRLQSDVLKPAREAGYQSIWVLGISLGGLVSLANVTDPIGRSTVDGLIVLAPYLGPRRIHKEVEQAGGVVAWRSDRVAPSVVGRLNDEEAARRVWMSFPMTDSSFPVYMGYGTEDRYAAAHRLFAGLFPEYALDRVTGDHDWPTWRTLWARWLDRGLLPRAADGLGGVTCD